MKTHTVSGIISLTSSVFIFVALIDAAVLSPAPYVSSLHLTGEVGYALALFMYYYLGYGALSIPLFLVSRAFYYLGCCAKPYWKANTMRLAFDALLTSLSGLALLGFMAPPMLLAGIAPGGYVGYVLQGFLLRHFEWLGSMILLTGVGLMGLHGLTTSANWAEEGFGSWNFALLIKHMVGYCFGACLRLAKFVWQTLQKSVRSCIKYQILESPKTHPFEKDNTSSLPSWTPKCAEPSEEDGTREVFVQSVERQPSRDKVGFTSVQNSTDERPARVEPVLPDFAQDTPGSSANITTFETATTSKFSPKLIPKQSVSQGGSSSNLQEAIHTRKTAPKQSTSHASEHFEPSTPNPSGQMDLPSLGLLHQTITHEVIREDPKRIEMLRSGLESKLADFSVQVKVVNVQLGPVISRYEVELAPGVKASKVTALSKDIARSLSVSSVRVVEVIPGKSYIGIEIPNHRRDTVALDRVFNSEAFKYARSPLALGLGVDISGDAVVVDLCKMPHLLVAGTTGSGKSVGLNALLLSLLFRTPPDALRLILIDPKMLEFAVYEGIPHLLTPVVTDMKDAACALNWCVAEMERRYKIMSEVGVRNISSYNSRVAEMSEAERVGHEPLPYIVVMADEFADMMMMVGKKVEQLIARLAQKARASGIHLILATQRPSVDVITGLIKANIPSRVAFQVSSKIDSRTILDQQGAEALLGSGDMLYLSPGSCVPIRCHGAYVSDKTISDVVKHLRASAPTNYVEEILAPEPLSQQLAFSAELNGGDGQKSDETLYMEAVQWVQQSRRASISAVQRKLRIGYNRAANLIDKMEAEGLISAPDNSGGRKVLLSEV